MTATMQRRLADMTLPGKLRLLLRQKGWSQNRLSEELGDVSRSKVSDWMQGRYVPDLVEAARVARMFGVSVEYLAHDEIEEPHAPLLNEDQRMLLRVIAAMSLGADEALQRILTGRKETGADPKANPPSVAPTLGVQTLPPPKAQGKGNDYPKK